MENRSMEILGVSRNLGAQIILSVGILFILGLGLMVQKQLYSFLNYRKKRHINKIIIFNSIVQNITIPIVLCYFLFALWVKNPSQFISDYGCYGITFIAPFTLIFDRSTSFSINLFRYICILHDTQLKKYNIHPKVKYISRYSSLQIEQFLNFSISKLRIATILEMPVNIILSI